MTRRQQQADRIEAMCDPHASVVNPDGTVREIDRRPSPYWVNGAGMATEIRRLQQTIWAAQDALRPPQADYSVEASYPTRPMHTITVDREDYDRLRKCAQIIEGHDRD